MNIKRSLKILVLPVAMLMTGISYADIVVVKPALSIHNIGDDIGVTLEGFDFSIDATAFTILTGGEPIDIPDTTFTLVSESELGFNGVEGFYDGNFSVGTLLTGYFSDLLVYYNPTDEITGFEGLLSYDGGSLMGDLEGGSIVGTFIGSDVVADLGEVAVVPVPAAVWLFGSGLIGLIGVARRKA